jgi:hypothetical protein
MDELMLQKNENSDSVADEWLNIRYEMKSYGCKDWKYLRAAAERDAGVIASCNWSENSRHAIIFLRIGKERVWFDRGNQLLQKKYSRRYHRRCGHFRSYPVYYEDPNDSKHVCVVPKGWFMRRWTGWATVIDPRWQIFAVRGE